MSGWMYVHFPRTSFPMKESALKAERINDPRQCMHTHVHMRFRP